MATKKATAVVTRERSVAAAVRAKPAPAAKKPKAVAVKEKPLPKSFGACADLLYTTREERLALQKEVDAMHDLEKRLKNHFIENLSKDDSTGAAGKRARVQVVTSDEPCAENWEETYKHIKKTGNFDLLNRALNKTAVKARWEAGKEVPGVGHFQVTKVSVTKI